MTDDQEAVAAALIQWVQNQLDVGADPSTIASALLGIGTDLMGKTRGSRITAGALAKLAGDIEVMNDDGSISKH